MLCLVRTKACKRCGGDLSVENDQYGTYVQCIQCGAICNDLKLVYPPARSASPTPAPRPALIEQS